MQAPQEPKEYGIDAVIRLFQSIVPLSPSLVDAIAMHSRICTIKKGEQLLDMGRVCKSIYFIVSGGLRIYTMETDGSQSTSWLLFENDLAIAVHSFFAQQPSFEGIEALEDSVSVALSYEHLQMLYQQYETFNKVGRVLTEQYYMRSELKAHQLRTLSAKQRYLNLLRAQPQVLQRVPLKYIASFLGITQSTLSRVRKEVV